MHFDLFTIKFGRVSKSTTFCGAALTGGKHFLEGGTYFDLSVKRCCAY